MAIWPFNRRRQGDSSVPMEVQEYYQSERREHVGVAWLLAALSLIATVIVVLAIYFGGKWIWNKIHDDNDEGVTTTQTTEETTSQPSGETSSSSTSSDESSSSSTNESSSSGNTSTSTSSGTSQSSATTAQQSATSQENLTNTGPRETIALFIGATIIGTLVHSLYTQRKLARS